MLSSSAWLQRGSSVFLGPPFPRLLLVELACKHVSAQLDIAHRLRAHGTAAVAACRCPLALPAVVGSFTVGATASVQTVSRVPTTHLVELPQAFQILTAHDSGAIQVRGEGGNMHVCALLSTASTCLPPAGPALAAPAADHPPSLRPARSASASAQVWGMVNEQLQPLIRIGDRVAPALRLVVCGPLGAVVTAHNGGSQLLLLLLRLPTTDPFKWACIQSCLPAPVRIAWCGTYVLRRPLHRLANCYPPTAGLPVAPPPPCLPACLQTASCACARCRTPALPRA